MASIPDRIHSATIRETVNQLRYEAGLRAKVLRLLDGLGKDLVRELADAGLDTPRTDWARARLRELLRVTERRSAEVYGEVEALTSEELRGLVEVSADRIVAGVNKAIGADLLQPMNWTTEQIAAIADDSLIFGAKSRQWWSRQAGDYAQAFGDQMRMGMLRGEALGDLVKRVKGLQEISTRNAERLVRSSVISVANEAHLAAFQANADIMAGVEWSATLDKRTCPRCAALDGKVWDLSYQPIRGNSTPFPGAVLHWQDRCTQLPVTKTWEELATKNKDLARQLDQIPPGERASMGGPVSGDTTWEGWFKGLERKDQVEILGPGRVALLDSGKVRISDLVDQRGNELTLAELRGK